MAVKAPASPVVDAYAHVGLPRFVSVDHYRKLMTKEGIARATLCSFDSSPDLHAIHDAFSAEPDRFRGIGVPLGRDRSEVESACKAQLEAGFSGLRLTDADVVDRPWLLDLLGAASGLAIVCGQAGRPACARACLAALDRHENLSVIGGHFAGIDQPAVLADSDVVALFRHPRFHVIFSRQGAVPDTTVVAWARELLRHTGWTRVMWGSEVPILFWRNETLQQALSWVDRLNPSPEERGAFQGGNAIQLMFSNSLPVAPLRLPFAAAERARPIPATMWARALPIRQDIAGRLVQAWLDENKEPDLGTFLEIVVGSHSATVSMTVAVPRTVRHLAGAVSRALSRQSSSGRRSAPAFSGLRRGGRVLPCLRCLRPGLAKRAARNEVALEGEGVVNGGMHTEKALGRSGRLEALHLALSSSHRLV